MNHAAWVSNFGIRVFYEFFFEIVLCAFIQISLYRDKEGSQWLNWFITAVTFVGTLALIGLLVSMLFRGGPNVAGTYRPGTVIQSFWGKRPLLTEITTKVTIKIV